MDLSNIDIKGPKGSSITKNVHLITEQMVATSLLISMNSTLPAHVHDDKDEIIYVVEGSGEITIGDETKPLHKGMLVSIPKNNSHFITALNEVLVILSFSRINEDCM